MRNLVRLFVVGAFLGAALLAPTPQAMAGEHLDGCVVWYEDGFCYYSCEPGGDGMC